MKLTAINKRAQSRSNHVVRLGRSAALAQKPRRRTWSLWLGCSRNGGELTSPISKARLSPGASWPETWSMAVSKLNDRNKHNIQLKILFARILIGFGNIDLKLWKLTQFARRISTTQSFSRLCQIWTNSRFFLIFHKTSNAENSNDVKNV